MNIPRAARVSIVLPAYNEEENILTSLHQIEDKVAPHVQDYEIIVVNDGSQDRTASVCEESAKKNPRIRIIHHPQNKGYGASLRDGFLAARLDAVFFTDADNQFDVSEIRYLLPLLDRYDVITGFRIYRYDSVLRCMASWCYNRLVRLVFGVRVRDVDCAFKLMKKEIFQKIRLHSNNFFICTELLAKARFYGFLINEIGVRHYPRMAGRTSVRPSDIPRTLRTLLWIWYDIHFNKDAVQKDSL